MAKDILKVVGINSKGYGMIPKLLMQDRKLTPESKCIYAYFCSYAGTGNTAFPTVKKIMYDLTMSKDRYYKHLTLLIEYGYLEIEQVKERGVFSHNIYTMKTEIVPCPENKESDKVAIKDEPCPCFEDTEIPTTENPTPEIPTTENQDSNINSSNINNIKINSEEKEHTDKNSSSSISQIEKILNLLKEGNFTKINTKFVIKWISNWIEELGIEEVENAIDEAVMNEKIDGLGYLKTIIQRKKKELNDPRKPSDKYEQFYI